MKTCTFALAIVFLVAGLCAVAGAADDMKQFPSCKNCNMSREKFAHSRMLIEYPDSKVGLCSIHCVAVTLRGVTDRSPTAILAGDYGSRDLIDALNAHWVIGGSKAGVMTKRAKWAFATKEGADAFVKEFGGTPATYNEALKAAYEDIRH